MRRLGAFRRFIRDARLTVDPPVASIREVGLPDDEISSGLTVETLELLFVRSLGSGDVGEVESSSDWVGVNRSVSNRQVICDTVVGHKHVRYATTRIQHKAMTFRDFKDVMHTVALRRAGYSETDADISLDTEMHALSSMVNR